ncbi:MAG: SGNH/GDSL hydrolase family protein [Pirellulales bacterium]|jgi:hypothetical protein
MPKFTQFILLLLLALSSGTAYGQQQDLPRVLIIGDSVYNQTTRSVAIDLKGKASVVYTTWPKDTVPNSTTAIEHLDHLLGRFDKNGNTVPKEKWPSWDLIHVNVGLGDLVHRMPNLESFRVLPIHAGGVVATTPKQYEKNLDELILKLNATGAKIVWASTTPIRYSRSNVFKLGLEIEYNKIADKVMVKHRVPTNDMYAYAKSIMNMDKPASHGADPFNFDKKPIHEQIVEIISRELRIKLDKPESVEQAAKNN